ncbi:hypothetical protein [Halegenticoccus tardaugens]|nr:hypothetical protein [Halegenticoccus tardaugens]
MRRDTVNDRRNPVGRPSATYVDMLRFIRLTTPAPKRRLTRDARRR